MRRSLRRAARKLLGKPKCQQQEALLRGVGPMLAPGQERRINVSRHGRRLRSHVAGDYSGAFRRR